jgi:hypothetical protein
METLNEIKRRLAALPDADRAQLSERLGTHLEDESGAEIVEEAASLYGTGPAARALYGEIVALPTGTQQQLRDWLLVNWAEEPPEVLRAIREGAADYDAGRFTIVSRSGLSAMVRQWAGESR